MPKGHIEKGEQELDAVRREVTEETGLTDIKILDGFTVAFYRKEWVKYSFRAEGKFITKVVTFYLAETSSKDVTISYEHTGYVWLPYEEAVNKLTFDNAKGILKKAHTFLQTMV